MLSVGDSHVSLCRLHYTIPIFASPTADPGAQRWRCSQRAAVATGLEGQSSIITQEGRWDGHFSLGAVLRMREIAIRERVKLAIGRMKHPPIRRKKQAEALHRPICLT